MDDSDVFPGKTSSSRQFFTLARDIRSRNSSTVSGRMPRKCSPKIRKVKKSTCPTENRLESAKSSRNPDLAKALALVAEKGSDAYYKGEIAQAILATSKAAGGTMAADDLSQFTPEWVEPVHTTYRDWTVYELPPNGQGMAALRNVAISWRPLRPRPMVHPASRSFIKRSKP